VWELLQKFPQLNPNILYTIQNKYTKQIYQNNKMSTINDSAPKTKAKPIDMVEKIIGDTILVRMSKKEFFKDRGGEPARLFSIVEEESDEDFWKQIDPLAEYFAITPLTSAGLDPNNVNDYEWFTGKFMNELLTRCLYSNDINNKIYYIIELCTKCSRYINDDKEEAEFKRFAPLFNLSKSVSLKKALEIISKDYDLQLVEQANFRGENVEQAGIRGENVEDMFILENWVEQNEDLYYILEPLHIFWKLYKDSFIDDCGTSCGPTSLYQMKIVMQNYDKIEW
jgi:hypothetical protein